MSKTCPDCSKDGLTNLGLHISQSNCKYPKLSDKQIDILNGLLMGDGHIRPDGIFEIAVKEKEYLENVVSKLPDWLITSSGVHSLYNEPTEGNLMWRFRTVSCDETKKMREVWYNDGKQYPKERIRLNPTTLRHWYATDGGVDSYDRPCIFSSNENTTELRDWLADEGYDVCRDDSSIRFNKDGAKRLMKEIGSVPGYEYKMPDLSNFSL